MQCKHVQNFKPHLSVVFWCQEVTEQHCRNERWETSMRWRTEISEHTSAIKLKTEARKLSWSRCCVHDVQNSTTDHRRRTLTSVSMRVFIERESVRIRSYRHFCCSKTLKRNELPIFCVTLAGNGKPLRRCRMKADTDDGTFRKEIDCFWQRAGTI